MMQQAGLTEAKLLQSSVLHEQGSLRRLHGSLLMAAGR